MWKAGNVIGQTDGATLPPPKLQEQERDTNENCDKHLANFWPAKAKFQAQWLFILRLSLLESGSSLKRWHCPQKYVEWEIELSSRAYAWCKQNLRSILAPQKLEHTKTKPSITKEHKCVQRAHDLFSVHTLSVTETRRGWPPHRNRSEVGPQDCGDSPAASDCGHTGATQMEGKVYCHRDEQAEGQPWEYSTEL